MDEEDRVKSKERGGGGAGGKCWKEQGKKDGETKTGWRDAEWRAEDTRMTDRQT